MGRMSVYWAIGAVLLAGLVVVVWYEAPAGSVECARPAGLPRAAPATRPSTRPVLKPRNDLPGLANYAQVSPVLYRGAQPTAEGLRQLRKMGIKTVVDLRALHSDRDELKGTGLRYLHIHCKAWHPEDEDIVAFLKVLEDPANHPVFVHCQHGADRTGCAVAAYRIVHEGWSIDQAMAELPVFGFHPVWEQIRDYLKRFDANAMKERVRQAQRPVIDPVE
jgi:protein tyrosine/serine phosphatase